jgi:transcriptional regulator with XRE-family HTH domain
MSTTLGKQVKKARIDRGWQQRDLVFRVRLTQKYLSDIENDKVDPRLSVVIRLAKTLGVSLDMLAGREENADG